jgi:NADPH:quinone reductase-like Zn-dependent oxidoreductase
MRAAVIRQTGTPVAGNVELVSDWPDPRIGAGEVVIRTEAAALNHLDLWVGRGMPGLKLDYPRISGSDGCGIVEAVGEGVDRSWIGKRVLLNAQIPVHDPNLPGAMAAKFTAPAANVLDIGDTDPVQAVAFGLAHLTAWRMLVSRAGLRPGMSVLITGIGGGVALAALNIARHFGCMTIVTSQHPRKLEAATKLGATHGVLDSGGDWSREVRGLTGKRGVDICADSTGKAVHLAGIKSLARGGVYVTCGATSGADAVTDLTRIFWNQLSIVGSTMGDMAEFRQVVAMLRAGAIKPVIDTVYEAADAAKAYARLESGEQFGKVVVRWE